jgi:4a-hydroxytetrahydrobiopterin dehydratase
LWLAYDATTMAELLSDDEVEERLPEDWEREDDEIVRTYEFDDYLKGVAFASEVGELAEEQFHHPEIRIRYEEVEVRFTSHEAGGITTQDIELAELCNDLR